MNEIYKDNKGKTYTCPYCGKVLTEKEFEDLFCSGCQMSMITKNTKGCSMKDTFLTTNKCDRCTNTNMTARIMSWFTKERICMECSRAETEIKKQLRAKGMTTMEGCGYVPDPSKM